MKKRIYISGAISGFDIDERKKEFKRIEDILKQKGFNVENPFDNGLPDSMSYQDHMREDLKMLLKCDYIYLMDGWEKSNGAKLEQKIAFNCGIKEYER